MTFPAPDHPGSGCLHRPLRRTSPSHAPRPPHRTPRSPPPRKPSRALRPPGTLPRSLEPHEAPASLPLLAAPWRSSPPAPPEPPAPTAPPSPAPPPPASGPLHRRTGSTRHPRRRLQVRAPLRPERLRRESLHLLPRPGRLLHTRSAACSAPARASAPRPAAAAASCASSRATVTRIAARATSAIPAGRPCAPPRAPRAEGALLRRGAARQEELRPRRPDLHGEVARRLHAGAGGGDRGRRPRSRPSTWRAAGWSRRARSAPPRSARAGR